LNSRHPSSVTQYIEIGTFYACGAEFIGMRLHKCVRAHAQLVCAICVWCSITLISSNTMSWCARPNATKIASPRSNLVMHVDCTSCPTCPNCLCLHAAKKSAFTWSISAAIGGIYEIEANEVLERLKLCFDFIVVRTLETPLFMVPASLVVIWAFQPGGGLSRVESDRTGKRATPVRGHSAVVRKSARNDLIATGDLYTSGSG
jgi:hypothetical protein